MTNPGLRKGDRVEDEDFGWATVVKQKKGGRGRGYSALIKLDVNGSELWRTVSKLALSHDVDPDLDDVKPDVDKAILAAREKLEQRLNQVELKRLVAVEERQRRIEDLLDSGIRSLEPTPLLRPYVPDGKPYHEDIVVTSDWHVGAKISMEETGGIYHQDTQTTWGQVQKVTRAIEHLHHIDSSGRALGKLHHLWLGDATENDIMRESQARKIDRVVTEQAIAAADMLTWMVRQELQVYNEVELDLIGGNHDRTSKGRGDAGLGELSYVDNWSWVIGEIIQRTLAEDVASGRLKVRNWRTYFGYKIVSGLKVVFEHGSSFKWGTGGYGGVPWYAVSQIGPRYAGMLGGADLIIIGHGHRAISMPFQNGWIVANGALPATSTYIQAGMKVVSRPQQWRLSTHEEFGITGFTPLYADVPGTLKPGDIWADVDKWADAASTNGWQDAESA